MIPIIRRQNFCRLSFPGLFKVNAMKSTHKLIALLICSAFVTFAPAQPESDIATPVEKTEITQGAPDLGQKQKEDWKRLREERKKARQQILSDIKACAKDEVKSVQEEFFEQKITNNENRNTPQNRDNLIHKEINPRERGPLEQEKIKPENPPLDIPRPDEHGPFPRGPKI